MVNLMKVKMNILKVVTWKQTSTTFSFFKSKNIENLPGASLCRVVKRTVKLDVTVSSSNSVNDLWSEVRRFNEYFHQH